VSVTTAQAVVERLEAHGVEHAFGIPGTHSLPLYRHLARSSITHLTPRHEQGAGYAADGYARACGRPAVCLTTTGPGLLNIATAAATAYADSVPMLIVSPGMSDSIAGSDGGYLHELRDQRGVMALLVGDSVRVDEPGEAAEAIDRAFDSFARERPRPRHIEIPLDRLEAQGDPPGPPPVPSKRPPAEPEAVREIAARLDAATSAAFVLGGGAVDAGAEAVALARALRMPVVTTVNGKATVPERDPVSLGASIRLPSCRRFLRECDLVLAVGTELGQSDLWRDPPLELHGELIRIDVDAGQLQRNANASLTLVADARDALRALLSELDGVEARDRGAARAAEVRARIEADVLRDGAPFAALIDGLAEALGPDAIVAGDSTMACYYGAVHLLPQAAPRRFLYPTGFATLGYAIPAAIGAKIARPDRRVLALIGDGGAMFTLPELALAVEHGLAIVIVVVNDGGYGEIRREMREQGQPPLGVELASPDFAALARAMGGRGEGIDRPDDLPGLLSEAFAKSEPTVIELRVGL
jgi:thiamine pyrophosphate-dependent acetolactate synthase large subunit-like protein